MVAEVFAGLSGFSTLLSITKSLKDMDDAVKRNAAVNDLWEKITSMQARYTAAIEEIDALKKELTRFETWESEKQRYELYNVGFGAFAYVLKPQERGSKPPHWVCTNCYESGQIKTLQYGAFKKPGPDRWFCPSCQNTIDPGTSKAKWPAND